MVSASFLSADPPGHICPFRSSQKLSFFTEASGKPVFAGRQPWGGDKGKKAIRQAFDWKEAGKMRLRNIYIKQGMDL